MAPTLRQTAKVVVDEDSMDVDVEPTVKLKTNDGKRFTLTKSEASCSNAFRMMIECLQRQSDVSTEYINLQAVNSDMLEKVIEWCRKHCGDDASNDNNDATCMRKSQIRLTEWDKQFLGLLTEEKLFQLMHVSNYLDVRSLFDACCQITAKQWEGKKVEEIRKMYNIQNDYTQEEEHQLFLESKRMGMDD